MANDTREARTDGSPVLLTWGVPEARHAQEADATLWLTGGATLLLWTALALLLTS